jgi:predicted transcriptional regulator
MKLSKEASILLDPNRFYIAVLFRENDKLYRNQIAKKMGIDIKLVKYHIDQMQKVGVIQEVGYETEIVQNRPMKILYYRKTKKLEEGLKEIESLTKPS